MTAPPSAVFSQPVNLVDGPVCPCDCCSPCCASSLWQVQASAIALKRSRPGSATLIEFPQGSPYFNASSFDFDYEPGFDISVRRVLGANSSLELRYFGIESFNASSSTGPFLGTGAIGTNPLSPFGDGVVSINIQLVYESELHSGEINYWRELSPGWRWSAGFRMLEVNENLALNFSGIEDGAVLSWDVDNRLYGFQLGLAGTFWQFNNFSVDGVIKAGVYSNRADQTAEVQSLGTQLALAQAKKSQTAFAGEAGLTATYRLSRNIALRAGYQVLFIDGVALASDQVSATGQIVPLPELIPAAIDSSSVLYHGGTLGVEFRW